ncbi:cob(I)yrinic acid a,c-diamide adenosyltransferase [Temperatibacter marinus]|uniref:Corrinoid adenosyltransferase n=1 Tax=Temperatibacter marinus TaxID=1456591 RepID=A0AA52EK66_9PROT|nr:cob(I)yrinic acid a,c-diamide adenosyltransferase [Temperatibacter marinus]WND03994.1 cob(I)yrinic acid a,c-diamide adenosyltransferase [Temperatibacter marinus]
MVKLNKIYTRTGDSGETGLVDGSRLSKADSRVIAYGTVDEANSTIGLVRLHTKDIADADQKLQAIQNDLFDLGADLATPKADGEHGFEPSEMVLRIVAEQVARLEKEIDQMNEKLDPLTSFILPGGSAISAHLHLSRTVVRRAERDTVVAAQRTDINPLAIQYLNRLSDHLFVMGRLLNEGGKADFLWIPGGNR